LWRFGFASEDYDGIDEAWIKSSKNVNEAGITVARSVTQ
jgi:hypothetical protein